MTLRWERFEHPAHDHKWTVLAFDGRRQVAGYIGPSDFTNGKMRAYRGSGPTFKSADLNTEAECRSFIEEGRREHVSRGVC